MALEVRDDAAPKRRVRSRTKQDSSAELVDARARTRAPRQPKRTAPMAGAHTPSPSSQLPLAIPLSSTTQAMQPPLLSLDGVFSPIGDALSQGSIDEALVTAD